MKKRILTVILALAIGAAMTACTEDTGSSSSQAQTTKTESTSSAVQKSDPVETSEPVEMSEPEQSSSEVATEESSQKPAAVSLVRFDGLYMSKMDTYTYYLRFFEDGKVVSQSTSKTPDKAWSTLTHNYNSIAGTYVIDGDVVTFDLISDMGKVTYVGKINSDDTIEFKTHSYINGNDNERKYDFKQMQ